MKESFRRTVIALVLGVSMLFCSVGYAENIDPNDDGSQYAWGENVGWINFNPSEGPGVTLTNDALTGYAWGENIGWINLGPANGGVINDGAGNLSGYAWGENVGWISFSCENTGSCGTVDYGVMIDPNTRVFSGKAWGENIGWINFVTQIDQEQSVIDTSVGALAIGGSSEQKLAQVVTAGVSGVLTDVRFPVACTSGDLIVEIQGVSEGIPDGVVLTSETIPGESLPNFPPNPPSFRSLVFSTPVTFSAGDRFAIVLKSFGVCGVFQGPVGDPYPRGDALYDARPNPPGVWVPLGDRSDLPFQTLAIALKVSTYTPIGTNITITLDPRALITFENVSLGGYTSQITSSDNPGPGQEGVDFLGTYHDFETKAEYIGGVTVTLTYDDANILPGKDESNLRIYHLESGGTELEWFDVTLTINTQQNEIIAFVPSLSWFALGFITKVTRPEGLQPPLPTLVPLGDEIPYLEKAFKQGSTLRLKLQLFSEEGLALTDTDVEIPPKIVALIRTGDVLDLEEIDLDAGEANDSGPYFRFSDGNWVYNLSTKELSAGTYSITLKMPDGRRFVTGFVLK